MNPLNFQEINIWHGLRNIDVKFEKRLLQNRINRKEIPMGSKSIKYLLVMAAAIAMTGCASFLTSVSPVQSKMVIGEKKPGAVKSYTYGYDIHTDKIILKKTPICNETAQVTRVAQKRVIGYSAAFGEMVLYGLGLVDLVSASAISEDSRKEYPLGEFDTGKTLACGKTQPAANEPVIIESVKNDVNLRIYTDANGMIDLKKELKNVSGRVDLNIYLESDLSVAFSCTYAADRMAGNAYINNVRGL
jgi:hypothetical protein